MSAQQAPFQQRYYPMHSRQKMFAFGLPTLHLPVVDVTGHLQVGVQTISSHRAAKVNALGNEAMQSGSGEIRDATQANTPNPFAIFFGRNHNQGFLFRLTTDNVFFFTTPVGLVYFDDSSQPISTRTHHRSSELVQHGPSRFIATKAQDLLQPQGTHSVLLAGDVPHCPKPSCERQVTVLENRSSRDRHLVSATSTQPQPSTHRPRRFAIASRANKPFRPAKVKQILFTRFHGRKATFEFHQRFWIILSHNHRLQVVAG